MRTDLGAQFLGEIAKDTREPVTLIEFMFPDNIVRLADQPFTVEQGWLNNWEPLIESWGNLRDNVRVEPILGASSLEVRQMTVNIINIGDPPFSKSFKDVNPENVVVNLYQWFRTMAPDDMVLIDKFVCQDPIVVSEAQAVVSIQLVSPIMAQNPFIWGPNKTLEVRYPMVLGKWKVVARDMITGARAVLLYDIDHTFTGEVFLTESLGDWPTPPFNVYIDSEQVTVSEIFVSKMNITARGRAGTTAAPHIRGALVTDPSANYDYSLTAGPVGTIDNILGDGEAYNNPYTVFPGQDPTIIRFVGRPPWHKVEAGEPGEPILPPEEITTQYGVNNETYQEIETQGISGATNINNAGSNAVMAIDDTIGDETGELYELFGPKNETLDWDGMPTINRISTADKPNWFVDSNVNNPTADVGDTISLYKNFVNFMPNEGNEYETFIRAYVEVEAEFWARGGLIKGEVILDIDGAETVLWSLDGIGASDPLVYNPPLETGQIISVEGIIKSWADLQNSKILFRTTVSSMSSWSSGTGKRWEVGLEAVSYKWHVYYTYDNPDNEPTYPLQEIVSHFNRDLSSNGAFVGLECAVRFDCSNINCTVTQQIVYRSDGDEANNQVLWSRQISSTQGMTTVYVYPSVGSMAALKASRVGVRHIVNNPASPGDRRIVQTNIQYVQWNVTYQPGAIDQPDEERVIYVAELTADVTAQSGANMTPARAIEGLLRNVANMADYIDQANFDEYHAAYDSAQYYFNGLIDGETRLHDALRSLIRQGSTRMAYNAGKIKLVSDFVTSLDPVVPGIDVIEMVRENPSVRTTTVQAQTTQYLFKPDMRLRSVTENRMRFDDVRNKITIRYKPDYKLEEWGGELEVKDDDSITQIGEQEESLDYPYVTNDDIIADIGARILELKGSPRAFDTFRCYFKAFPFEKSDQVFFETDFQDYYGVIGPILTINRVFASGKAKKMNIFEVTIMATPIVAHELNITDTVLVNETYRNLPGFSIHKEIFDTVNVAESVNLEAQFTIFLELFDVVQAQEAVGKLQGVTKTLELFDEINLADALATQSVLPINLELADTIELSDNLSEEIQHEVRLEIFDTIEINALVDSLETITGYYGTGGYGEGGYGGSLAYSMVYFKTDFVTHGGDDVIHYN